MSNTANFRTSTFQAAQQPEIQSPAGNRTIEDVRRSLEAAVIRHAPTIISGDPRSFIVSSASRMLFEFYNQLDGIAHGGNSVTGTINGIMGNASQAAVPGFALAIDGGVNYIGAKALALALNAPVLNVLSVASIGFGGGAALTTGRMRTALRACGIGSVAGLAFIGAAQNPDIQELGNRAISGIVPGWTAELRNAQEQANLDNDTVAVMRQQLREHVADLLKAKNRLADSQDRQPQVALAAQTDTSASLAQINGKYAAERSRALAKMAASREAATLKAQQASLSAQMKIWDKTVAQNTTSVSSLEATVAEDRVEDGKKSAVAAASNAKVNKLLLEAHARASMVLGVLLTLLGSSAQLLFEVAARKALVTHREERDAAIMRHEIKRQLERMDASDGMVTTEAGVFVNFVGGIARKASLSDPKLSQRLDTLLSAEHTDGMVREVTEKFRASVALKKVPGAVPVEPRSGRPQGPRIVEPRF